MGKKLKLIIFDLDGTLMNAYKAVELSLNFTLCSLGLPIQNKDTIRRSVGWGDRNLLQRFLPPSNIEKALRIYRRHHSQALKVGTKFLPGAKALLEKLFRDNYLLAVASNRPTKFSLIALNHLKIRKYFDYILCADKLKQGKPHPEILKQILQKLNVSLDESLYVGDMTIDVETGNNAGVKTVAVLTGSSSIQEINRKKPFKVIKNISKLTSIINHLNK